MKKNVFPLWTSACIAGIISCNNGGQTVTTDSTSTTGARTDTAIQFTSGQSGTSKSHIVHLNPNTSYVDLKSGKTVKLRVDTVTQYIINQVTNQPIMFFIDAATRDTFDRQGRLVNGALTRGTNGEYIIDETMLSSDETDSTMNSDDTTTTSTSPEGSGSFKEKTKNEKYKYKDDNSKIKVKTKIKNEP